MTGLDTQAALDTLRSGGFVVLLESNDAEAEGNLMAAAQFASPDSLRAFSSHELRRSASPFGEASWLCYDRFRPRAAGIPTLEGRCRTSSNRKSAS